MAKRLPVPRSGLYPDNSVVERTYTDRGQLFEVKLDGTIESTDIYDGAGRRSTVTYADGMASTFNYRGGVAPNNDGNIQAGGGDFPPPEGDRDDMLADITTTNPGSSKVGTYNYEYDANKNKTRELITGAGLAVNLYGFSTGPYDAEDRLVAWNRDNQTLDQSWNLSLVGDFDDVTTNNGQPVDWIHNDAHEVTTVGGVGVTHDVKGNVTQNINGHTYTWDFDNKMSSADTNGDNVGDVTFQYDALGRRVAKNNTAYALAGQQVVAEYALGAAPASPSETFVYGSYIDEPILKTGTGGKVYYARNQQYSVVALLNAAGSVVERYAYSAYGDLTVMNAAGNSLPNGTAYANPYTYTGRRYDAETELYYFRARYYDSKRLSRFLSKDPIGYPDGMNPFAAYFVPNGVDPSGTVIKKCECTTTSTGMGSTGTGVSRWNRPIFTTGTCQTACCPKGPRRTVGRPPYTATTSCTGKSITMSTDEKSAAGLCAAIPKGVDSDNNGISDFDECESSIANLMGKVSTTTAGIGSCRRHFPGRDGYCFPYIENIKRKYDGWNLINTSLPLPGGCILELVEVEPSNGGTVFTGENSGFPLYKPGSYGGHGVGRICCGTGLNRKCMYFDVGSESYTGQFGGDDKWFPPDGKRFCKDIDQDPATQNPYK